MKITLIITSLLLSATMAMGQSTPQVAAPDQQPQLTKTEELASRALLTEFQAFSADLGNFQQEIGVTHKGYFFNFQNGQLEKTPPPVFKPIPPPTPAEKK